MSNSQVNDAYVLEIPPGEKTHPRRQLFDEAVLVMNGQGATSLWYDNNRKRSFEWQEGSVFAIPPNVWYEYYAMGSAAKLVSVTSAPLYMQLFNNRDFIFHNDYRFSDRYNEEDNYFRESINYRPGLQRGRKQLYFRRAAIFSKGSRSRH